MAGVKAAEVSAILKQQIEGFTGAASMDEVGTVLQVGDGIARVYGLSNVQYGELVSFEGGVQGIVLNLEADHVGVVLLSPSRDIVEGSSVKRTERIASIKVGEGIVGRVVDTLGQPIDGKVLWLASYMKCRWSAKLLGLFSVNRLTSHCRQVSRRLTR